MRRFIIRTVLRMFTLSIENVKNIPTDATMDQNSQNFSGKIMISLHENITLYYEVPGLIYGIQIEVHDTI